LQFIGDEVDSIPPQEIYLLGYYAAKNEKKSDGASIE